MLPDGLGNQAPDCTRGTTDQYRGSVFAHAADSIRGWSGLGRRQGLEPHAVEETLDLFGPARRLGDVVRLVVLAVLQLLQQVFLLLSELERGFDCDRDQQVDYTECAT